jgi:hypothetical protein
MVSGKCRSRRHGGNSNCTLIRKPIRKQVQTSFRLAVTATRGDEAEENDSVFEITACWIHAAVRFK